MKIQKYFLIALAAGAFLSCEKHAFGPSGTPEHFEGDEYNKIDENPFIDVADEPISTFSIDADGASYSNVRRYLQQEDRLPPADAVRTEELINYFRLGYPYTDNSHPINLNGEISQCPWNESNKLIRIGIKGQPLPRTELPPSNFVFLIDVSGSMSSHDRLELLKTGFKYFVDEMQIYDRVAIVSYGGQSEIVLNSTPGHFKDVIKEAIDQLGSGGGTAGAEGIRTAYEIAESNFIEGGNNRVIMGTDGDFNVGISSQDELIKLIEEKRESGIFLTTLGVGRGNLHDGTLEQIANNGNGTYEYLDNVAQLQKVFIYEYSKFYSVAKDVKAQVEFNPGAVESYRLIGYENRLLSTSDFEDDSKDAGEIGAGQDITALYEIVPKKNPDAVAMRSFTIDVRYKEPDSDMSIPMQLEIYNNNNTFAESSDHQRFVASIAAFGMLLRNSKYKEDLTYAQVSEWLSTVELSDAYGFKAEFKGLVKGLE